MDPRHVPAANELEPDVNSVDSLWNAGRAKGELNEVAAKAISNPYRYIKELADRLNSLESQIQHPQNQQQNFDFGTMGDQTFTTDTQSPPQFKRQRTHSMTEGFQEAFGRPSWSGQDRGNDYNDTGYGLSMLTSQELPVNGNRRTSFGEMSLVGNLIAGSNEETLKA
jgi:hypothetical protein